MAYGDFKDLARKTAADKFVRDKALFNISKNLKNDGYQRGLASMVYNFFDKKSAGSCFSMHAKNERPFDLATHQLAEDLCNPTIRNFKKGTVYSI